MSDIDINDCLNYYPFEGDFGLPTDRTLKDKIGIARKSGPCSLCDQDIQPKEKIRIMACIFDGELHSYRWCEACCIAMATVFSTDHGLNLDPVSQRYRLRNQTC